MLLRAVVIEGLVVLNNPIFMFLSFSRTLLFVQNFLAVNKDSCSDALSLLSFHISEMFPVLTDVPVFLE